LAKFRRRHFVTQLAAKRIANLRQNESLLSAMVYQAALLCAGFGIRRALDKGMAGKA
jgi:hypothetical protein